VTICPACGHEFRTSDRGTLAEEEENARLRAELARLRRILARFVAGDDSPWLVLGAWQALPSFPLQTPVDNSDPACG
jgi:hypothetical protein